MVVAKKKSVPKKKKVKLRIWTTYMDTKGKLIRTNFSLHAAKAVVNAIGYMQRDYYKAHMVEVFDSADGTLFAVIKWRNKSLVIVYTRDPRITLS